MLRSGSSGIVVGGPEHKSKKSDPWANTKSDLFDTDAGWRLSVELSVEGVLPTAYDLIWFTGAFGFSGWIPICIPPAAFQLKWTGGENFPGFFFAFGALRVFGSHGNEFFGNVSVCTFKFVNRHVHPPVMVINPSIWYWSLSLRIHIFCWKFIHFILFVKENQVMNFVSIGKSAILKYCLTGLPLAI